MKNKRKNYPNQRVITCFIVFAIVLIAFLTYRDMLDYFFTIQDTISSINRNRIQSFNDVVRTFTEPLLGRTRFYRPITVLTGSLDYSIWKLNPFGYHLTDMVQHILVCILIFFLIRFLTNGKQITACLSAIIFATHPILVETVPGGLRSETMVSIFMLLSLLLFLRHLSTASHKKVFLLFSIFFYAVALGSKEIAIILPPLIFVYLILFSSENFFKNRVVLAVKGSLPYLIITFIFFVWVAYVFFNAGLPQSKGAILGAIYKYKTLGVLAVIQKFIEISKTYFVDLLYPVDFLGLHSLFNFLPRTIISLFILFFLFIFLLFYRVSIFRIMKGFFIDSDSGKLVVFLLIWLFLPLSVYLFYLQIVPHYMYIVVIPFSSILSIMLVESFQSTIRKVRESVSLINKTFVSFIVIAGLLVSFFVYSPLVRSYKEWEYTANISKMILDRFSEIVTKLPNDAVIHIYNLPFRIHYHKERALLKKIVSLDGPAIKNWLDLNYPNNNIKIIVHTKSWIRFYPSDLNPEIKLEIKSEEDKNVVVNIIVDGTVLRPFFTVNEKTRMW